MSCWKTRWFRTAVEPPEVETPALRLLLFGTSYPILVNAPSPQTNAILLEVGPCLVRVLLLLLDRNSEGIRAWRRWRRTVSQSVGGTNIGVRQSLGSVLAKRRRKKEEVEYVSKTSCHMMILPCHRNTKSLLRLTIVSSIIVRSMAAYSSRVIPIDIISDTV